MLDIKFIRENEDLIQDSARKKHIDFDVKKLIEVDDKRKDLVVVVDEMRAEQNSLTEMVPSIQDEEKKREIIEKSKEIKEKLQKLEENLKEVMKNWKILKEV